MSAIKNPDTVYATLDPNTFTAELRPAKSIGKFHPCSCGCGLFTRGYYAAGHDAQLKSLFKKVVRGDVPKDSLTLESQRLLEYLLKNPGCSLKEAAASMRPKKGKKP